MQEEQKQDSQYIKMTQTPIGSLISKMAVPTIISMLVTAIYNMADTFFVSKLGTSASGAVGIVFSLMAIIQAIGFTIGMGSGSWISRLLGEKEKEKATQVAASGFYSVLIAGLLIAIFGRLFISDLMRILGASDTILPYARDYAQYILYAAPIMGASFVLNNILRSEGRAQFAMIGIATGGILNIALDPLFIFVFGLGIGGAAIATALSQCISFLILLSCFLRKKTTTSLSPLKISRRLHTYVQIIIYGMSSLCRQGLASVATILLNKNAALYGDAAVAGMSIVSKIFMMMFSIILGFGQGYQPVAGYNYGAKHYHRVKESIRFTLKVGTIVMTITAGVVFLFAPFLIRMFIKDDPMVIEVGTTALRAQCLSMPLTPLNTLSNMTYQATGRAWTATFLAVLRQGVFFIPLILILPGFLGLFGVEITQACADAGTFIVACPFLIHFIRGCDELEKG